ncbi:hypothetical protein [Streptomyces sp. TLI_105]|uniref:hypothetical protein n=1 Tax=Streptomyces sp. TLI_105 TaxID=1881019 RepID=UPI00089A413E|nr:M6 family metalloprotease domain-containing protein [Streptomyces sp. TLI_105]
MAHETGHAFGLPDLYGFTGTDAHRFVAGWDVRGLISGPGSQYSAWHSWKLGWTDDAPFRTGESFTDATARVRGEVLGVDGYGETARVTKWWTVDDGCAPGPVGPGAHRVPAARQALSGKWQAT